MGKYDRELESRKYDQPRVLPEHLPGHDKELTALQILTGEADNILIVDLDDTLYDTFSALTEYIPMFIRQEVDPEFSISSLELRAAVIGAPGGRFDNTEVLKNTMDAANLSIDQLINHANSDPQLLKLAKLFPEARALIQAFATRGIPLVGALTARPEAVIPETYAILHQDGFRARIPGHGFGHYPDHSRPITVLRPDGVTTQNPAGPKIVSFERLLSLLPPQTRIHYPEDTVKTAIEIHARFKDRVTVIVPLIPRNLKDRQKLEELGIVCGTHAELVARVQNNHR